MSWVSRVQTALTAEHKAKAMYKNQLSKSEQSIKDAERLLSSSISEDTRKVLSRSIERHKEDRDEAVKWIARIEQQISESEKLLKEAIKKEGN